MSEFKIESRKVLFKGLASIRLSLEEHEELKRQAKYSGVSITEIARQMIAHCLQDIKSKS
jgi:predicted DNA-binding protein